MARVPINRRILTCDSREIEFSVDTAINLSDDTVFQFLSEEYEGLSPASSIDDDGDSYGEMEDENENENRGAVDEIFWESQNQLLQSTICRTSSLESRIRNITKEALKEAQQSGVCGCGGGGGADKCCRKCLMTEVCGRLQNAGFNSAICKSKWRSSTDIPSGEHTFLDVLHDSNGKKEVRVIIELNFRAQFEMARGNEEYNKLVNRLPELFVGKIERLLGLLKILCRAAKKCMKERKMHMGPWRKHRYMQAKWLKTCERLALPAKPFSSEFSGRPARPRKSLLTLDLMMDNFALPRPVVGVV